MDIFDVTGEPHFDRFVLTDVNPVSGRSKKRYLSNPNDAMKKLHERIIKALRSDSNSGLRTLYLRYATGSSKGNSPLSNVMRHRHNRHFYLLDFANAFRSVEVVKFVRILREFDPFGAHPSERVREFVDDYLMDPRGGLTQGGNASTDLFNLYVGRYVDVRLGPLLEANGITFTRYLDDLTFSSPELITAAVREQIRQMVIEAGFWINHKKCEVVDLEKRTIVITGVGLGQGGRIFVPRPYLRKVRGFAHKARTRVELRSLAGMVNFIEAISRANGSMNQIERRVIGDCKATLGRHGW